MKPHYTDWGECPDCGKIRYATRKRAREVAKEIAPGSHLAAYKCGDYWHLGNLPRTVIEGDATRQDLRPARPRTQPRRTNHG